MQQEQSTCCPLAGKDRTGIVVMLLLLLCGVDKEASITALQTPCMCSVWADMHLWRTWH